MTKLRRTTFEVSRASEYFDARQLSALVGVSQDEFAGVCLKELVDNSLDACETSGVAPVVGVKVEREDDLIRLSVSDNGPGIPVEVVRRVLDYNFRVSDKAAYRSPTRGAQGNALKTVIGIPYALGSREPLVVEAQGVSHRIRPWVDPAGAVHFDYAPAQIFLESVGTTVSLQIPGGLRDDADDYIAQDFDALHWVRSFAAFNPHATVSYQIRAMIQKPPKFTNRPTRVHSRSTCRASRPVRTGTAPNLLGCWSSATLATPARVGATCRSESSSGSFRDSPPRRRLKPSASSAKSTSRSSSRGSTARSSSTSTCARAARCPLACPLPLSSRWPPLMSRATSSAASTSRQPLGTRWRARRLLGLSSAHAACKVFSHRLTPCLLRSAHGTGRPQAWLWRPTSSLRRRCSLTVARPASIWKERRSWPRRRTLPATLAVSSATRYGLLPSRFTRRPRGRRGRRGYPAEPTTPRSRRST